MNNVSLVGRLTKDAELKKTQSGLSTCSFTLACDRPVPKEKRQQEGVQTADFIQCVAWRHTADFLGSFGKKGYRVAVTGRIMTRSYDRQDGTKAYVTEVLASDANVIEPKQISAQEAPQTYGSGYREEQNSRTDFTSKEAVNNALASEGFDISDDDLPF